VSLVRLPHYLGQAFAPDQYGSPVYANLILLAMAVVFVLTLLVYRNRGPVLILLGLFAVMPVYSGVAHWYKSEQRNHWFGYWFGHDMFTPPYGIYPEMTRDAILFGGTDPGRFCPTYMIFCESFIPHKTQPVADQRFDRRDVYIITQNALADATYLQYIRSEYFRSAEQDPPFFSELFKYCVGVPFGPESADNGLVKLVANLLNTTLDGPFTKFGASVEKRRRVSAQGDLHPLPRGFERLHPGLRGGLPAPPGRRHVAPRRGFENRCHGTFANLRPGDHDGDQRPAVQSHFRPQPRQ
jgi:hypothetical protein